MSTLATHPHTSDVEIEACWDCITESLHHELSGAAHWIANYKAGHVPLDSDFWLWLNDFREAIQETYLLVLTHERWT